MVFAGGPIKPKRLRRLLVSLTKYHLRMSHRNTPLRLFAGVALTGFGGRTGAHGRRRRAVRQPDGAWLAGVAGKLHEVPGVLARTRLVASPRRPAAAGGRPRPHGQQTAAPFRPADRPGPAGTGADRGAGRLARVDRRYADRLPRGGGRGDRALPRTADAVRLPAQRPHPAARLHRTAPLAHVRALHDDAEHVIQVDTALDARLVLPREVQPRGGAGGDRAVADLADPAGQCATARLPGAVPGAVRHGPGGAGARTPGSDPRVRATPAVRCRGPRRTPGRSDATGCWPNRSSAPEPASLDS